MWKLPFFLLHYCTFRILKRFQQRFLYSKTRCFFGFKPLWKAIFRPEYQFYLSKMGFRLAVFAHNFCNKFTFRIKAGASDLSKIRVSMLGWPLSLTVGKKTQGYVEKCDLLSEIKPHPHLILWWHGVFSLTKVCIFLPMVFDNHVFHHNSMFLWFLIIMFFITILIVCLYDFCLQNSCGKKMHTLPRYDLIFPNKCHKFYTGFYVVV